YLRHGTVESREPLELTESPIDQVVAYVCASRTLDVIRFRTGCRLARQPDRAFGDLTLRQPAPLRDAFDRLAITVARCEIHLRVRAGRVGPQHLVDLAHGFDEAAPVDGREETQTADGVADRYLVGRLVLVARLNQLVRREARFGQSLLDPAERKAEDGALPLQEADELGYEWRGHGRIRARHVREHQDEILGVVLDGRDHPAGPDFREVTVDPASRDPQRHPAEVLDQRETQHDRDRPELAEVKRRHAFIAGDKALQSLQVDPPVSVRDRLERDLIDAG